MLLHTFSHCQQDVQQDWIRLPKGYAALNMLRSKSTKAPETANQWGAQLQYRSIPSYCMQPAEYCADIASLVEYFKHLAAALLRSLDQLEGTSAGVLQAKPPVRNHHHCDHDEMSTLGCLTSIWGGLVA